MFLHSSVPLTLPEEQQPEQQTVQISRVEHSQPSNQASATNLRSNVRSAVLACTHMAVLVGLAAWKWGTRDCLKSAWVMFAHAVKPGSPRL